MLIRKFALLFGSAVATYAPAVLADCSGLSCESVYIETLIAESAAMAGSDDVWVRTSGNEAALKCTANSGAYVKLSKESETRKEVYALLMMAFAMDKPVSIRIVEDSADCVVAYAYINR